MSVGTTGVIISHEKRDLCGSQPSGECGVALWWLGQAGFALKVGGFRLLIDPYLSDSLAEKYAGTDFPHIRMMQPPMRPADLRHISYVLCTHRHTDHMDPGTLPDILNANPECRVVLPRSQLNYAHKLGFVDDCLCPINAGEILQLDRDISLKAIPSAHETLQLDEDGNHLFLGYILKTQGLNLYHSGDCVPYPGLTETILAEQIDVALLPVNGRDDYRTSRGILGNFSLQEAASLCRSAGIEVLVVHHFGMFEFNTVPIETLEKEAVKVAGDIRMIIPEQDVMIMIKKSNQDQERRIP